MVSFSSRADVLDLLRFLFRVQSCLSERRQAAEKQVEKAGMKISHLKTALSSKEQELHDQHQELVRLRQAEDALAQAEDIECNRLRVLADSLVCKLSFLCSSFFPLSICDI